MKRIIAIFLVIVMCVQLVACTAVQDALYDVGVDVNFDEVWLEMQGEWKEVKGQFSEIVQGSIDELIASINDIFKREELSDTAVPKDKWEYYLDFPLEKVYLPASERTVYILPLNSYAEITAYRSSDGKQVTLEEAGFTFDTSGSRNTFSIDSNGIITGDCVGHGSFSVSYSENGKVVSNVDDVRVFIAESNVYEKDPNYIFPEEEKNYIVDCLDLSYTLYKADDNAGNLTWGIMDNIALNINNLSDNLAAFFKIGENIQQSQSKRIFLDFFNKYCDEQIKHVGNYSEDWKNLSEGMKYILEIAKVTGIIDKNGTYVGLKKAEFSEIEEAVDIICEMLSKLGEDLKNIENNVENLGKTLKDYEIILQNMERVFKNIKEVKKYCSGANIDKVLTKIKDTVSRMNTKVLSESWNEFGTRAFKTNNGQWNKLAVAGEVLTIGINFIDAVSYSFGNYEENIKYIELIEEGLIKYKNTLPEGGSSIDYELECISSLCEDYKNSVLVGFYDFLNQTLAQGVQIAAGLFPPYALAMFIASISSSVTDASDKEKAIILSTYANAIFHTLDPIDRLYTKGQIDCEYHELRYRVSLYLNLLLEINYSALKSVKGDEKKLVESNIEYIEQTLKPYLNLN